MRWVSVDSRLCVSDQVHMLSQLLYKVVELSAWHRWHRFPLYDLDHVPMHRNITLSLGGKPCRPGHFLDRTRSQGSLNKAWTSKDMKYTIYWGICRQISQFSVLNDLLVFARPHEIDFVLVRNQYARSTYWNPSDDLLGIEGLKPVETWNLEMFIRTVNSTLYWNEDTSKNSTLYMME